jgi:hypothetical protein
MSKKKTKTEPAAKRSEIIEQCVVYAQSIAAHAAGFEADHTCNCDYAGANRLLKKAKRAMIRLIALSPAHGSGPPLSALELRSKASVLGLMKGLENGDCLDEVEAAYIRIFAGEVQDFLASQGVLP